MTDKLTMTDFLKFLMKLCAEKTTVPEWELPVHSDELAAHQVYREIAGYIQVFLEKYSEQKKLGKDTEKAFLAAIETDRRRVFEDDIELIKHIHEIAARPPFFDSERVSLAAINAFCVDHINRHNMRVHQELIQSAPF